MPVIWQQNIFHSRDRWSTILKIFKEHVGSYPFVFVPNGLNMRRFTPNDDLEKVWADSGDEDEFSGSEEESDDLFHEGEASDVSESS